MYQVEPINSLRSQGEVFVSYSHHDREIVRQIVASLEKAGFRVYWDQSNIPGDTWDAKLDKALDRATCVVVIWSNNSVNSKFVRAEALKALERNILVAARIDQAGFPVPFNVIQTADLRILQPALMGGKLSEQQIRSYRAEMDKLLQGIDRVYRSVHSSKPEIGNKPDSVATGCGIGLVIVVMIACLFYIFSQNTSQPPRADVVVPTPRPIATTSRWSDRLCIDNEECTTGDFNGDGRTDVAVLVRDTQVDNRQGDVNIALSTGDAFADSTTWADFMCTGASTCKSADVNGDNLDDLVEFGRGNDGIVQVALSTGNSLLAPSFWGSNLCVTGQTCEIGDFDGDDRADVAVFNQGNYRPGLVQIALNTGNSFGPASVWHTFFCIDKETCGTGDFNGDGKDDVIAFAKNSAKVYVAFSSGEQFVDRYVDGARNNVWHTFFCLGQEICAIGDFNGDSVDDIAVFLRSTQPDKRGDVYVAYSSTTDFGEPQKKEEFFCIDAEICDIGDFDGNGLDDVVAFLQSTQIDKTGHVYVSLTP